MDNPALTFGHYRVLTREGSGAPHELGRGAMGITYKAVDTSLGNFVALKVINQALLGNETSRTRFVREARAAAQLSHANVARVFHLEGKGEDVFYAMEFIEGETLEACVRRQGPLDPAGALRLGAQIARGLQAAHAKGLLHRDLKPANVMLVPEDDEPSVKIIDFGLVKRLDSVDGAPGEGEGEGGPLSQGGFCGTPQYGSPEQFDAGGAIDARADLYSLGATLWFLLEGRPPFEGSLPRIVRQVFNAPLPVERLVAARGTPAAAVELLRRLLAREPGDRPPDAAAARQEILRVLETLPAVLPAGGEGTAATLLDAPLPARGEGFDAEDTGKRHAGNTGETVAPPPPAPADGRVRRLSSRTARIVSGVVLGGLLVVLPLGWLARWHTGSSSEQRRRATFVMAQRALQSGDDEGAAAALASLVKDGEHGKFARENLARITSQWRRAADALLKSDPPKAASLYTRAAAAGDAASQYNLGVMYEQGNAGLKRDPAAAARLYAQAAAQGDLSAQFNLARLYELGEGVPVDLDRARALYEKGAAAGELLSETNLGHLYDLGLGVKQDYARALTLYRHAAEAGNDTAQCNLAAMYQAGRGVPKPDYVQAALWLEKAAKSGNNQARNNLATLYEQGYTAADGKPDYARAATYYRQAAESGLSVAQLNLGTLYLKGSGVAQDVSQAIAWYRLAAQQGESSAAYNLGVIYGNGLGVPRDTAEAARWYRQTAEAGLTRHNDDRFLSMDSVAVPTVGGPGKDKAGKAREKSNAAGPGGKSTVAAGMASGQDLFIAAAQHSLGTLLLRGDGVEKDPAQGVTWLRRAGEAGFAPAQSNLGLLYLEGRYGVAPDAKEAVAWLRRASDNGDLQARSILGRACVRGTGMDAPDPAQGVALLRDAAKSGNEVGQAFLGDLYRDGAGGLPKDHAKALALYRDAVAKGSDDGQCSLGVLYENGWGVTRSKAEAVKWYGLAAARGNADARQALERLK